ncbi:MAG TPA: 16S rRNA (cytosine(1402)-N(4))-methyltransferase RsmH [Candidatus Paceibacterota bacterium]
MHVPVLLKEVLDSLAIKRGEIFLDCTAGAGGHCGAICRQLGSSIKIVAIDQDEDAINRVKEELFPCGGISKVGNFRNLDRILDETGIKQPNKILFDLGLSSNQLEESHRGFSFLKNEPLIMTFDKNPLDYRSTAAGIVNSWNQEEITDILLRFGEERRARKIAEAIVSERKYQPITTAQQLAALVAKIVPRGKIHPATKTFQALRIAVNDELNALTEGLSQSFQRLAPKGRLAVISFHSLEDRIVKNFFRDKYKEGLVKILTKKPLTPTIEEIAKNSRARSAKLRIIEKI